MRGLIAVCICFLSPTAACAGSIQVLHTFGVVEGANGESALVGIGSTLFGTTTQGGTGTGAGVVFSINKDGSNYQVLHDFQGALGDGASPFSQLTIGGGKFFGTTNIGGTKNQGSIYSMNLDGTGYAPLRFFTNGLNDGGQPIGGVAYSGGRLYGTTQYGNNKTQNSGTVYSINADGTGFTLLHSFAGGTSDGSEPLGDVTVSGSTLFGTSFSGGASNKGIIFSMHTDGTGFSILHSFSGAVNDGAQAGAGLTLVGTKLYGMTSAGGTANRGTLFSIGLDGSGFGLLHSFGVGSGDGARPLGNLTLVGSTLFGATSQGGDDAKGTLFSIQTDGTGYSVLHSMVDVIEGNQPVGNPWIDGNVLYGTTFQGAGNGVGSVYALTIPEPSSVALLAVSGIVLAVWGATNGCSTRRAARRGR